MHTPRPDSPPLGENARFLSGISNVSETDRGHLRGISETSLSTDGNHATPHEERQGLALGNLSAPNVLHETRRNVVSPLTPPEGADESATGDYLGAGSPQNARGTTRRKSNFAEGLDEVRK
jgi:hypothetical protein